jgi:protein-disulfide isomerase/uncharacterized membrane protein
MKEHESNRRISMILIGLALVGLLLSIELTRIHYRVHTDPSYHALCDAGGKVRCGSVALSPDSVVLGAPVSVWGFWAYVLILVLTLWGGRRAEGGRGGNASLLLLLSFLSCLASLRLAWVSLVKIDAVCVYCTGLHLVNAALLLVSAVQVERRGVGLVRVIRADGRVLRENSRTLGILLLLGLTALLGTSLGWPRYWVMPRLESGVLATGVTADGEPWIGAVHPTVTIVEYSDYECPYCRLEHRRVRALVARHPDRVRLVHRHFPLDTRCHPGLKRPFHEHACQFALFAACAARQGLFWEANDALIFALEQRRPERVRLEDLAVRIGLEAGLLRRCGEEGKAGEVVAADIREGIARGVTGTPTYWVNGERQEGTISPAVLRSFLADESKGP